MTTMTVKPDDQAAFLKAAEAFRAFGKGDVEVTDWGATKDQPAYRYLQLKVEVKREDAALEAASIVRLAVESGAGLSMYNFPWRGQVVFDLSCTFYGRAMRKREPKAKMLGVSTIDEAVAQMEGEQ
jgi:hypothetical protein